MNIQYLDDEDISHIHEVKQQNIPVKRKSDFENRGIDLSKLNRAKPIQRSKTEEKNYFKWIMKLP
jgi:hypothetical protein